MRLLIASWLCLSFAHVVSAAEPLPPEAADVSHNVLMANFQNPPASARPWAFWFWVNGNVSKEGITKDIEAFHRAGISGLIWMEVSGQQWAPKGAVTQLSPQWHECMQWAISECARVGMTFDISVDFGYGSGGPHIMPETSMQQLVWSETIVEGGKNIQENLALPKTKSDVSAKRGTEMSDVLLQQLRNPNSYKDVAVVAMKVSGSAAARDYRIMDVKKKSGLSPDLPEKVSSDSALPAGSITPIADVIDLTSKMDQAGHLNWDAPAGSWQIIRFGHASNLKLTHPCPEATVGLECDRLAPTGIDAHYHGFLEKIFSDAGSEAGKALGYVHIDSWEAGGQNWTKTFPAELARRRGYDLIPWLPVLTGRVIGSAELSERFLWDVRTTVSEMICANYANRLRELAGKSGIKLSIEPYGNHCIDNLTYAGVSDFPISEFWALGNEEFPKPGMYEPSTKAMTSAAHTYGKPIIGAEAFTSARGWSDHPFTMKAMGDQKFCEGLNRMVFHCSVHQPYDRMVPGLTHKKWGEQFQRFNTWWNYSRVWTDYLSRCQYVLQQGQYVADICVWFGEGAPLSVNDMKFSVSEGYAFDFCSSEIVLQMRVEHGRIILPSGMSYRYVVLPDTDRMTLPLAQKIRELVLAGAQVIGKQACAQTPGLTGYPQSDLELAKIAQEIWGSGKINASETLSGAIKKDQLTPDFIGQDLLYIHRTIGDLDVYYISHQKNSAQDVACTFRITGKVPELWDPETGAIRALTEFSAQAKTITVPLHFTPMQSWFVVFRPAPTAPQTTAKNFSEPSTLMEVSSSWQVSFDPAWGGPSKPVTITKLFDWSENADPAIKYYSGTAVYRTSFNLKRLNTQTLSLNLGTVQVMARVKINGKDCGIAWKPPYCVNIAAAVHPGSNELEIDVVNLWLNRMIGDEYLPEDSTWEDQKNLSAWPDWFQAGKPSPTGRFTFTSYRHYKKNSPLSPSGLLGPVTIETTDALLRK